VIETTLSVCIFFYCLFGFLQNGLATKVEKSRKQMKERKNRAKKIRGVKKV
jgi:small subunit ribosomal protein S24e